MVENVADEKTADPAVPDMLGILSPEGKPCGPSGCVT